MPQTVPGASDRSVALHCTPGPAPSLTALEARFGVVGEAGMAPFHQKLI